MIRCVVAVTAMLIFACDSQDAIAGYIMHVHFGDPTEAKTINSASEILTAPIGATVGSNVTANFLLEVTGDSTLYFYRFSVRYKYDTLGYVNRSEDSRPDGWGVTEALLNEDESPDPVGQSSVSPLAGNFLELRRFDGESLADDDSKDIGAGFYKLGSVTYELLATPMAGELLILPGRFEIVDDGAQVDDDLVDTFLSEISPGVFGNVEVTFQQGIVAVPEPSSLLLLSLGASGMLGFRSLRTWRLRRRALLEVK